MQAYLRPKSLPKCFPGIVSIILVERVLELAHAVGGRGGLRRNIEFSVVRASSP